MVTVLTFLFVLLLADYLAGLILRPIRELERGAQMIGAGALDYIELASHRGDELGQLARSFNAMADNLQDTQSQIRAPMAAVLRPPIRSWMPWSTPSPMM